MPKKDDEDARDRDEDEAEQGESEDEAEQGGSDDEAEQGESEDEAEEREEPAARDEAEDQPAGDEQEKDDEAGPGEADRAQRVAAALGVEEEAAEEAEKAPEPEPEAAPNRAQRRRDEAMRRRKKRLAAAAVATPAADAEDEELPRDKNQRAKELLKRRREQASGARRPVALLPSEMVDDALARSANAFTRWVRTNSTAIQVVVVALLVAGGGYLLYNNQTDKKSGNASGLLATAVAAERGRVTPEDKRTDDEKEADPARVFKTADERNEAALADYQKVAAQYPGTGVAILARLGEAGVLLDKRDWDKALEAYSAVSSSALAGADPDVKKRALEGIGYAKEGKGDLDGALAAFRELERVDMKGTKELAMYHQARVLAAKGDKDQAKELLKSAREKLHDPGNDPKSNQFLQAVVDETLRGLDPTAVPARSPLQGPKGTSPSPEEFEKILRRAQEAAQKKGGDKHDD